MTQQPQKKQPQGEPTQWSDADLDALSTVTAADIVQAVALWKRDAPKAMKDLLDARVIEVQDEPTTRQ